MRYYLFFPMSNKCAPLLLRRINLHVYIQIMQIWSMVYKVRDETSREKCRADREPQAASAVLPAVSALSYFSNRLFSLSCFSSFSTSSFFSPSLSFFLSLSSRGGFQTCTRRRIYRSHHVGVSNDELSCQL